MAEKAARKATKQPKRKDKKGDEGKLSKTEQAIARHLRFNCPTKTSQFSNEQVHYFTASKAVDTLLESKWGAKAKKDPMFTNRNTVIAFMQTLMSKNLFWRARKLVPKRKERPADTDSAKEKKERKDKQENADTDSPRTLKKKSKKEKEAAAAVSSKDEDDGKKDDDAKKDKDEEEKEGKKKKKIKLEIHSEQVFLDGSDVYVWIFDPTPWTKWLIGLGLVLGSILVCLFPLWPPWLRLGIYYLSLVAMGFVGLLLGLAIFRTLLFGFIWCVTLGEHHLWLLPNLTEDCGFFESFKPFYSYKKRSDNKKKTDKKKDDDAADDDEDKTEEKVAAGNTDSDRDSDGQEENDDKEEEETANKSASSESGSGDQEEESPAVRRRPKEDRKKGKTSDDFEMVDGSDN